MAASSGVKLILSSNRFPADGLENLTLWPQRGGSDWNIQLFTRGKKEKT